MKREKHTEAAVATVTVALVSAAAAATTAAITPAAVTPATVTASVPAAAAAPQCRCVLHQRLRDKLLPLLLLANALICGSDFGSDAQAKGGQRRRKNTGALGQSGDQTASARPGPKGEPFRAAAAQ